MIIEMKIGVVGNGFVGNATRILESNGSKPIEVLVFDIIPEKCIPLGTTINEVSFCDIVFICVPTPMNIDGSCHTKFVENAIISVQEQNENAVICVRSTVPVGFCNSMNVDFMPEFLTEKNWQSDFPQTDPWIIGLDVSSSARKQLYQNLFNYSKINFKIESNIVKFVSTCEGELIKYTRNVFLATKVSFCNELYDFCKSMNIDYNNIKNLAFLDKRIGTSHTNVPGPDGKYGFGGTCFPKDVSSMVSQFHKYSVPCKIIEAVKTRNLQIDRPEKDWELDLNRAVVDNN